MNFLPLIVTVWPALWPPEYRATTLKRSERTSTILPLPSSPHCAPIMTAVLPGFNFLLRSRYAPGHARPGERPDSHTTRPRFEIGGQNSGKIAMARDCVTLDSTGCTRPCANTRERHHCHRAPPQVAPDGPSEQPLPYTNTLCLNSLKSRPSRAGWTT